MKRKLMFLSAIAALCIGGASFAQLLPEDAYVGGIGVGVSDRYVIEIYGTPTSETRAEFLRSTGNYVKYIEYGTTVKIACEGDSEAGPFRVTAMVVSGNNGFTTARGIHVNSTKAEVYNTYGNPEHLFDTCFMYEIPKKGQLAFYFQDDKVSRIVVGYMD